MSKPTIRELEELGKKIYDEIGELNKQPDVHVEGKESAKAGRIRQLTGAAEWNALALQQLRKQVPT